MPIEFDNRPGSAKDHVRQKDGKLTKTITPAAPRKAPAAKTVRVRMLKNILGSRRGNLLIGQTASLPSDVARHWINIGLAEEDKALDSAPETQ